MDKLTITTLADDLAVSQEQIIAGQQTLDEKRVYAVLDGLGILDHSITTYFDQSQDAYYGSESNHQLNLLNLQYPLKDLQDRILTNHVDGFVDQNKLHLTYNHENPFEDGLYSRETDFHVLLYSLKVIGAVYSIAPDDLTKVLTKDAVLSLGLAAYSLVHQPIQA
jgi:hypothetical protein